MTDIVSGNAASPKKSKLKKFLLIFLLAFIAACVIYYFICGMAYSRGTRSGILTKVSEKGYVFKTYEGEMNVGGLSEDGGTIMPSSIFKFSVTDKATYDLLEKAQGHRVVLHYRQVMKNFFWQGETDYFIDKVEIVK
ncbi:MAG: hypothetical protein ACXVNO_06310 [Bacteroidia bacterium]